jgi:hypothetical protein
VPTETIILIAVIVTIFTTFAGVLAWGERQTRNLPQRR